MRSGWILAVFLLSTSAFAAVSKDCNEIKAEQLKLAMLGSNLANENTTHTPEGGPYRPIRIKSCTNGSCEIERVSSPIMKYLPDHPDADVNGYVAFPNIDRNADYIAFNMIAAKLRLLGNSKLCETSAIDNGNSVLLSYAEKKTGIKEDIFNFDKNRRVVSWMRTDSKGNPTTINFMSDGKVGSYQ